MNNMDLKFMDVVKNCLFYFKERKYITKSMA